MLKPAEVAHSPNVVEDASRARLPPWPEVVEVVAELNAGLRGAAAQHGARVASIQGYFLGHELRALLSWIADRSGSRTG